MLSCLPTPNPKTKPNSTQPMLHRMLCPIYFERTTPRLFQRLLGLNLFSILSVIK